MPPTYAVIGATGNMGQCLLTLFDGRDCNVNAFARSRSKLESLQFELCQKDKLRIYEGNITNIDVLADCLRDTIAAFLVVAVTENQPDTSIAQDTATNILKALHIIKDQDALAKLPRLVIFSSSSVSDKFSATLPHLAQQLLMAANSHIYADLTKAEEILRAQGDFVSSTFVKPGGLVHDVQRGHELSTESQQTFISYLDVAAGMIEVADSEGDVWDQKEVSVHSLSPATINWIVPIVLGKGLLSHYFPGCHWLWRKIPGS